MKTVVGTSRCLSRRFSSSPPRVRFPASHYADVSFMNFFFLLYGNYFSCEYLLVLYRFLNVVLYKCCFNILVLKVAIFFYKEVVS
jgi:hypothetical protein